MSHQQAKQDIRMRQRQAVWNALAGRDIDPDDSLAVHKIMGETQSIGLDEINKILREAGLPEASDEEADYILNGESALLPEEVLAFQAAVIAQFLQDGGYASLADAMEKLGLDWESLQALIHRKCLDLLGHKDQ